MAKFKTCFAIFLAITTFEFYGINVVGFPFLMEKTLKIDRFLGKCPGMPNLPFYFKDVHFIPAHRVYYISTKIVANRDISEALKLVLELERCKSKEALDSCEPYPDVTIKNICEMVSANFQPWTPLIKTLTPPLSCPVKKGTYTSSNGTFDGSAFAALPVEGFYWKVRAKVSEINRNNNLVMCVYVEGQIANV